MNRAPAVLIVDDSRVSRMMSRALLVHLCPGAEVGEAVDGEAALALAASRRFDLAILDMNMPGMDGIALAGILRARDAELTIALLTANAQDAVRLRAEAQGVSVFRKPVNETVIADILLLLGPAQ